MEQSELGSGFISLLPSMELSDHQNLNNNWCENLNNEDSKYHARAYLTCSQRTSLWCQCH
jgi:hypothetical protein